MFTHPVTHNPFPNHVMRRIAGLGAMLLFLLFSGCVSEMTGAEGEGEEGPKDRVFQIERADGGRTSVANHKPPFAIAEAGYDVRGLTAGGHRGRMDVRAIVPIGVFEHPISTSYVYSDWSNAAGDYRVSADVKWKGFMSIAGIAGTGAKVEIVLKVLSFNGSTIAREVIHSREMIGEAIANGILPDQGSDSVVLDFTVPDGMGGPFRIQFETRCEAIGGLFSGNTACVYGGGGDDGFVEWTRLEVTEFRQ